MYEEYRQVSQRMGLELSPSDPGMMTFEIDLAGIVDGRKVSLHRFCGRGAYVRVTSPFARPLDLGLGVGPEGILSSIAELLGAHDIEVGDAGFDSWLMIRGDEPERVRALLGPEARRAIGDLRGFDVRLTDADVSVQFGVAFGGHAESVPLLEHLLRQVGLVAGVIDAQVTRVPPSTSLRPHYDAWMAFAGPHGMAVRATPLALEGRAGRSFVAARAIRQSAGVFGLELSVGAEQSLDAGLWVRPRRTALDAIREGTFGDKTIPTGDAAFDTKLEVRARTPEHVRALLDDGMRARLLELGALGDVFLDDRVLSLHAPAAAIEPASFPRVIDAMRAVVEARFESKTAYR